MLKTLKRAALFTVSICLCLISFAGCNSTFSQNSYVKERLLENNLGDYYGTQTFYDSDGNTYNAEVKVTLVDVGFRIHVFADSEIFSLTEPQVQYSVNNTGFQFSHSLTTEEKKNCSFDVIVPYGNPGSSYKVLFKTNYGNSFYASKLGKYMTNVATVNFVIPDTVTKSLGDPDTSKIIKYPDSIDLLSASKVDDFSKLNFRFTKPEGVTSVASMSGSNFETYKFQLVLLKTNNPTSWIANEYHNWDWTNCTIYSLDSERNFIQGDCSEESEAFWKDFTFSEDLPEHFSLTTPCDNRAWANFDVCTFITTDKYAFNEYYIAFDNESVMVPCSDMEWAIDGDYSLCVRVSGVE